MFKKNYAGIYKILFERYVRVEPNEQSECIRIVYPDDLVEAVDLVNKFWLKLKDDGYVCEGHGCYAKRIKKIKRH